MKLGLYGGAFNPIHRCHLVVAQTAHQRLGLDRVLFIPTGDAPHKPAGELMAAGDRLEMVKLATAPFPYFEVTDIETRRTEKSYSIDTVRVLTQQYPAGTEFVFIIGLDAFVEFPNWKEPEALLSMCDFAVISRSGTSFGALAGLPLLDIRDSPALAALDSSSDRVRPFSLKNGHTLWTISMPPCEVSAKDIRRRLLAGESLADNLPESVHSYILRLIKKGGGSPL
jgi:nicotinate-nucleotide adenylyltransferase